MKKKKDTVSRINENELTKLYYSIGEVANMFDVNTSLIRFWEKEFPSIKPKKNSKGNRLFTPKEIVKIDRIHTLVKEKGYTLEGAKQALRKKSEAEIPPMDHDQIIDRLEKIRNQLLLLKTPH